MKVEGIKKSYPLIPLSKRVKGIIQLIRPFTLIPVIFGSIFGAIMCLGYHNNIGRIFTDYPLLIHATATLILLQCGSNMLNQSCDAQEDKINKTYRPIPQGIVSVDESRTFAVLFFVIALFRAATINLYFGFFLFLIMIATIMYSMSPIRLKKRLWLSNIDVGLGRGFFAILCAWSIFYPPKTITPFVIATLFGIFVTFQIIQKDFSDIEGDKKAGNKNIVIYYGVKKAQFISIAGMLVPFFLIPALATIGVLSMNTIWISALFIVPVALIMYYHKDIKLDTLTENTPMWKWTTLLLAMLQIAFCISYVMG